MTDWLGTNRRLWDERVPVHVASGFYDVEGFKSGRPQLQPFEVEELGPLDGLRLLHLQCHFGLDTLDIARLHPTVSVTGLDFSAPAIEAAGRLAREVCLADRARFVVADVYRAPDVLDDERFDVIYTGKGSLLWLPDLHRWASVVHDLLLPGGVLYLSEFHPVANVLDADEPVPIYDYFDTEPLMTGEPGTYVDARVSLANDTCYEWQHSLSRVITAVLGAGFQLQLFHEWNFTLYDELHYLVQGPDGRRRWPGSGTLPLMYSLKAIRHAH